jgi:CubicO group peptidase (beta-lactamase class C family)
MKRSIISILGILSTLTLGAQNYSDSLTIELAKHLDRSDLPGFSVSIVNESEILYSNSFGFANKENQVDFEASTILNLGSVSKTIVGLALVKAIEDGKLTLDTKINDILPFQVINPYSSDSPILVRHLANHTSTILDTKHYGKTYVLDDSFIENENIHQDFLGFLRSHSPMELRFFLFNVLSKEGDWYRKKNFLKAEPGSTKEYSNLNAALTAYIIELATETPFEEYTQSMIFEPLGMHATSWRADDENLSLMATPYFPNGKQVPRYRLITYPDGGLYSNSADLSNYLIEMIKAYSGNSTYLTNGLC